MGLKLAYTSGGGEAGPRPRRESPQIDRAVLFDAASYIGGRGGRIDIYAVAPITPEQAQAILAGDADLGTATLAGDVGDYAPADMLSVTQAAELLALNSSRVRLLVGEGRVPATRVGRVWVIETEGLIEFAAKPRKVGKRSRRAGANRDGFRSGVGTTSDSKEKRT